MSKIQETVLEIDLLALKHNFKYLQSKLHRTTKMLAVVKAFGYGSDAAIIANYLEKLGLNYLAVAYTNEGVSLRKAGVSIPILVLHPQPVNFETLIEYRLEPSLYNKRVLTTFLSAAKKQQLYEYPIHIKFNTGLNRLGFLANEVDFVTKTLLEAPQVKVHSIFSHLAASEDCNEKEFTQQQITSFKKIAKAFQQKIKHPMMLHQLNTSGVINYPEAQFDMVRCGIGLYGFANDPLETNKLKMVASLKSIISQIHYIEKGASVGYNKAFTATVPTITATIPIGHADGIHRAFGNGNGFVTINGKKAPIVGNVCMDMLMVDITGIDCGEGDEVVIFSNQETVNELAENINSISYEIVTAISQRVKRIVK